MILPANLLTGTKHSAFSTNDLTDTDKTEHNYQQSQNLNNKTRKLLTCASTKVNEIKPWLRGLKPSSHKTNPAYSTASGAYTGLSQRKDKTPKICHQNGLLWQSITSRGVVSGSEHCTLSSWQTQSMRAGDPSASGEYALTYTSRSSAGTRPHWRATLTAVSMLSPVNKQIITAGRTQARVLYILSNFHLDRCFKLFCLYYIYYVIVLRVHQKKKKVQKREKKNLLNY